MDEPWGLSGPQFIGVFIAGMVVALLASAVLRRLFAVRSAPRGTEPLSVDEVAYLIGGERRVVESALAWLIDHQRVRVQRHGKLSLVANTSGTAMSDLQRAVAEDLRRHPGRTVARVRHALANHPEVQQVRGALRRRGLVVRGGSALLFGTALPVIAVEVIGIVRFVNGVRLDRPVGILVVLLLAGLVAVVLNLRGSRPWLTSSGRAVRRAATRGHGNAREGTAGEVSLPVLTGAVGAVAVGGLVAFPDRAIAAALQPPSSSGGGGDSGGGSSCGGGCGGGGCGG